MELKTATDKYLITKEEYEFLNNAKQFLFGIRNNWFSDGRILNKLAKQAEKLNDTKRR